MFLPGLFSWWYSTGWRDQATLFRERLSRVSDRFSITLLLSSFFSPFRQISAEGAYGKGLDAQFRAWLDKLISRCIGAMVRSALILTGALLLFFELVIGAIRLVAWPLLPVFPLLGLLFMASGWIPWQI